MTLFSKNYHSFDIFQLTSSRGGWQLFPISCKQSNEFQLTSSRGGWRGRNWVNTQQQLFQLTSSRGGWHCSGVFAVEAWYFNSHPHEEDDLVFILQLYHICISTHILTRRMTTSQCKVIWIWTISTHILTRRMTSRLIGVVSTVVFQLTSSRGGWLWTEGKLVSETIISTHILTRRMTFHLGKSVQVLEYFNSHPHEEDDYCLPFLGTLH